jgi:hypothetical protein
VKLTQIVHHENTEKVIAPTGLLDSSDQGQQMQCSFRESPMPNQNQNNSKFSEGYP